MGLESPVLREELSGCSQRRVRRRRREGGREERRGEKRREWGRRKSNNSTLTRWGITYYCVFCHLGVCRYHNLNRGLDFECHNRGKSTLRSGEV